MSIPKGSSLWKPLVFTVDSVNTAKSTSSPLPGTVDMRIEQSRFELMDGSSALMLSAPDPIAHRYRTYHLLKREKDQFIELEQPTLFRKTDEDRCLLLFAGAYYFQDSRIRGAGNIFSLSFGSRTKEHPQYIMLTSDDPIVADVPPDGTSFTVDADTRILFGGHGYSVDQRGGRSDNVFEREGWFYLSGMLCTPREIFRARKGAGHLYEIEPWPSGTHRFPESGSPAYIAADDSSVLHAIAAVDDDRIVVARNYDEYTALEDTGDSFRTVSFKELSPELFDLIVYDEPLARWRGLEGNDGACFLRECASDTIDIADLITDDQMGIRRSWNIPYRIYDVTYGDRSLVVRVPDIDDDNVASVMKGFSESDLEDLRVVLCSVPKPLIARCSMITVAPDMYLASGRYRKGGLVAFTYPWTNEADGLRIRVFHELGHSFAEDATPEQRQRLEAVVNYAIHVDGEATYYRENESRHWGEALAVAFGEFEKAGSMMQQVVLNLMLNPMWQLFIP